MTAPAIKRPAGKTAPAPAKAPAKTPSPTKASPSKASAEASAKDGKKSAKGLSCLCGCGQATLTDAAKFRPGHDAKLKGVLLKVERGELPKSNVPEIAKPFLQRSEMSGAWSFPTESGNTPDEDKYGKPFSERREEVEAEKAAKKAARDKKLAELKAKKSKPKSKSAPATTEEDEDEEEEEEE